MLFHYKTWTDQNYLCARVLVLHVGHMCRRLLGENTISIETVEKVTTHAVCDTLANCIVYRINTVGIASELTNERRDLTPSI